MFNYLKSGFILLLALFSAASVQAAGGIALGATRVIYPADAKQTSLSISNSDTKERGRDADLVVMVDCQIPSDDLIVHFF